jgi:hypothetical protein
LLVGSLLIAPAAWASGEDVREPDAAAKSDKQEDDPKRQAASGVRPEAAAEGSTAVSGEAADETTEPAGVDPSFNTIEDILAYRGRLDSLWTPCPAPEPEVVWRDLDARPAEPR